MKINLEEFRSREKNLRKQNKIFFKELRGVSARQLDSEFHRHHEEVFSEINCLDCANCCKTTSPLFTTSDIDRLAKHFRLKASDFIDRYLKTDEDGDFVLQSTPCPFLGSDNYCGVYEARPKACREYPHTNRNRMQQIMDLTEKNCRVCPAVLEIVERMKKSVNK